MTTVATELEQMGASTKATISCLNAPTWPQGLYWAGGESCRKTRCFVCSIWLDRPQRWSGKKPLFCFLSCDSILILEARMVPASMSYHKKLVTMR